jgi:oligosaccharyl transferase (archaeosortase A-associated)
MSQRGFSKELIAGIIVALFFAVALYLRVALPFDKVIVGDWVKFTGVDAYFFMHIVDNLARHFPHLNSFDPYLIYPTGASLHNIRPLFVYFLAGIVWIASLGSATQHIIDMVGIYFPAVLGALTVIPVYFIGRALFNRWAGVIAAGLVGIFPGEFLGRSLLGFTDYHVAEVLFTTMVMLFLILAVKSAKQRELAFNQMEARDRGTIIRPLVYSLLAGIFLATYILTWQGALLFVFIIFAYIVIQFVIDHLRNKSTDYLCLISFITFGIALVISQPIFLDRVSLVSLIIAILISVVLALFSNFMARRGTKPIFYPLAILGLGVVSLAIIYVVNPSLLTMMMGRFGIFSWPIGTTNLEMQPIFFPGGEFSLSVAWCNFTTGLFLSFISLVILIYLTIRRGETDKTLFVVWSLVMLAATLSMRRFAYYFVVNVALLTGYLSWLILEFTGFRKLATVPLESPKELQKKIKHKDKQRSKPRSTASRANMVLGVIVVFVLVFYPNIGPLPGGAKPAIDTASQVPFAPSDAWCESLYWMRDNTPDPFDNPNFYYELYESPGKMDGHPKAAYGVTSWWDYGYWIIRIGHRVPTATPGTADKGEASFFAAQDEGSADKILLDRWGLKYVIVDYATSMTINGKFSAVAKLSGNSIDKFFDIYYQPRGAIASPVPVYYPKYYRSLIARLYNFDGKQVVPLSSTVISYEERLSRDGQPYKEITGVKSFPGCEAAQAYIASQKSGNYRIVGTDPFASPVPLEALEHYKLIYSSKGSRMMPSGDQVPEVKIFEYAE